MHLFSTCAPDIWKSLARVTSMLRNVFCAISKALLTWESTIQLALPSFMVFMMLTRLVILMGNDTLPVNYSLLFMDKFFSIPRSNKLWVSLPQNLNMLALFLLVSTLIGCIGFMTNGVFLKKFPPLFCDGQSTIQWICNHVDHCKIKFVDIWCTIFDAPILKDVLCFSGSTCWHLH